MGLLKATGVVYKPVNEVDLGPDSDEFYLRANVKAPRMAGLFVKVFTWFLESPIFGGILLYFLKRNNLIHKLVSFAELQEPPLFVPLHPYQGITENEVKCLEPDMSPPGKVQQAVDCLQSPEDVPKSPQLSFERWTILDYARAYTSGETTPKLVADRFIASVHESSSRHLQMSFFINYNVEDILKQATESTARHARGEPISVLDGVPVAIKDEIDCMPYPTTGGTKWMHKVRQCKNDACCVSRLRACGAIIVGKTNMHELGAGISGINPHYGAARNPYNRSKITGGSSSGSAAVVAAGLCPVALGVDGGGSVRLPAALCGVVGLKPTFARVPHDGVLPINYTVGMVGILAATVEDALITYAAISGGLPSDHPSITVPKIGLPLLKSANYMSSDIKMAIYREWFNDCTDDIRECCSNAVAKLSDKYGWQTVEVTIPDMEVMRLAHYLTIGSECSDSIASYLENMSKAEIGWDVRVGLSVYSSFDSREYLNAQRIRNRQLQFHENIFSVADVIVTPTVGVTAYTIKDDCLKTGELDYINGAALVRYQIAGNFLGLPAVTVPVGYDKSGLPIGLQFIGKPWSESLLIHIASALQALCKSGYKKPEVFFDMLAVAKE
ncbi:Fatty acid amide hydrolase [Sesamum alatum]|uniref:Fatty acid amide hydrolase n=1 Tax=Sesamum alatum TaxID=300844 RepID=A0AAE2CC68_9LAMI|nr:Fatty acid amide hydrolase [Sesamum alatum]